MSSYPRSLSYYLTRLNGFSRNKYRIQTLATTTFQAQDTIAISLPEGLLDLNTFSLTGLLSTTVVGGTNASCIPPYAEALIDSYWFDIGGVSLQTGFTQYNQLFNILRDFQLFDKMSVRGILQNDGANLPDALPDSTVVTNRPIAISQWLGFLGSNKFFDTTLLPPVKLYIRLAPRSVCATKGAPTNFGYNLSNVRAQVDIISVDDGIFNNLIQQRLKSSPIEIPFQNVTTVMGGAVTSATQALRWNTSAHCLNKVISTFLPTTYTDSSYGAGPAGTKLANYFTRKGDAIVTAQTTVNSVPFPSFPLERDSGEIALATMHTLGVNLDCVAACNPDMNSHVKFNSSYWCYAHNFGINESFDEHRLVGLDGRGNVLQGVLQTSGGADNIIPLVFLLHTSVLRVGANRTCEIVL
ncbi:TPA_asm: hexon [Coelastrella green algae MELD virus]|nr:TPA_asm: hexon [Coelastrella green algae MELD virus]